MVGAIRRLKLLVLPVELSSDLVVDIAIGAYETCLWDVDA
jgi:hypothetical protein